MPINNPDLLRQIPMFELLDEVELKALADQMETQQYWAGQMIFQAGDAGGVMMIVQSGHVELSIKDHDGQKVVVSHVKKGELFGEISLLDNHPRSASAKAEVDTVVLIVDRNDLQVLFRTHPDAAFDILATLGTRLREADMLLGDRVAARNPNELLAAQRTLSQKLADGFARVAGDMRFLYASIIWFTVWIVWNMDWVPGLKSFDPFPFGLLTMIVSLEAIFLSTFVLISQNRQAEREKVRNDIEYEVNIKAELEIRDLHVKIDELQELLIGHLHRVDSSLGEIKTQTGANSVIRDSE